MYWEFRRLKSIRLFDLQLKVKNNAFTAQDLARKNQI